MSLGDIVGARETFNKGVKECNDSIPLWLLLADLEVGTLVLLLPLVHPSLTAGESRSCDQGKERGGEGEAEESRCWPDCLLP